ncbi:hypothetical protein NMG60_11003535 [Bertholletia excelsa]
MAYTSNLLVLALLLFATTSLTHAFIVLDGRNVTQVTVVGRVFCTATGNAPQGCNCPNTNPTCTCPGVQGAAGALAFVSCNGGQNSLGQAFTDTTGFVRVIFQSADGIIFDRSKCALYVRLPVASCAVLPPTGLLYGSLSLIDFVQSTVGLVANMVFGLLQRA